MDQGPIEAATLFDHAACALVLTGTDGLILRVNVTACVWLGYNAEELVNKLRMRDLLPVGARLFYHTHCQPILDVQGSVAEIQVELINRRRERLPILLNIMRRREGHATFDHWALFKASDRHAYERELLAARKAAEAALEARHDAEARLQAANSHLSLADQRKDEFLATLSHELRNPLAPMRSALDVLKFKLGDKEDPRVLQVLDRQLHHLTRLVDDLMEVSRITQGRIQLSKAPVELSMIVNSAAQDLTATMSAARHTLHVFTAEPPVMVHGDATRLTQVVINLLTNAAKYTPDGGIIDLQLRCSSGMAEIQVRDNGIGISADALSNVFEMFSQLEPALERSKGGLGIGLALVRGIIELHDGTVGVTSDGPGKGSEFTVRLPLVENPVAPTADAASKVIPGALRILVVDDNRDAADTLTMALEVFGCETRTAYTGAEALVRVPEFLPQAVLLDIGLPDINGYELARRLRSMPSGADLTLVAATGWGQPKDRETALAAGFDHHLTKPIDLNVLCNLLPKKTM